MALNSIRRISLSPGVVASIPATPTVNAKGQAENLDARSADNLAMLGYWDQVDTICQGAEAVRLAGKRYLPMFPDETQPDYDWRLSLSKFTNVYRDIVEGLASKPFETVTTVDLAPKEVVSADGDDEKSKPHNDDPLPDKMKDFVENVDGSYTSITGFAASLMFQGVNDAITWIFVDYPNDVPAPNARPRSIAEEKELGVRPFWTMVLGRNVLEARSAVIAGSEVLTYVRLLEPTGSDNFVRIMYRDQSGSRWELWKQDQPSKSRSSGPTKWMMVDEGIFSIGLIPLVPMALGRRRGRSQFYFPPMRDAADLQLELYWQESGLKHIKTLAAFPMLAGNGVKPATTPDGKVRPIRVAPMAALYAPPDGNGTSGSWQLLEPSAATLTFLQSDVEKTIAQLRELGRNPLTAQSGNLTVVTTMVAAKKGNSAVQMWAGVEENALDTALYITALWYGIDENTADRIRSHIFTDFDIDGEGGEALTALKDMRQGGDLSQRTLWKEMQRRDILSADFDAEAEENALLDEGPSDDGTSIDPVTGRTIPGVKTKPGEPPTDKDGNPIKAAIPAK